MSTLTFKKQKGGLHLKPFKTGQQTNLLNVKCLTHLFPMHPFSNP